VLQLWKEGLKETSVNEEPVIKVVFNLLYKNYRDSTTLVLETGGILFQYTCKYNIKIDI
jgi:hypothetical protein